MTNELLVRKILEQAQHYDWSIQGFGMLRLYLSREVRLHVWDSRYQVDNVSIVHDHPVDLTSKIISGEIRDTQWEPFSGTGGGGINLWQTEIVCGENAVAYQDGAPTLVEMVGGTKWYRAGDVYTVPKGKLHHSEFRDGTVTLVKRSNRDEGAAGDRARSLWPEELGPEGWVSAKPRKATRSEVLEITQYALEVWGDGPV